MSDECKKAAKNKLKRKYTRKAQTNTVKRQRKPKKAVKLEVKESQIFDELVEDPLPNVAFFLNPFDVYEDGLSWRISPWILKTINLQKTNKVNSDF